MIALRQVPLNQPNFYNTHYNRKLLLPNTLRGSYMNISIKGWPSNSVDGEECKRTTQGLLTLPEVRTAM